MTPADEQERTVTMRRGVAQLLFSYLPGRTIDWEGGAGIVELRTVGLSSVWERERAQPVVEQVGEYLERWRSQGGVVHRDMPGTSKVEEFVVGTPESISGVVLEGALRCLNCGRMSFEKKSELARRARTNASPLRCPSCRQTRLRQFTQVFVHGCGALVPLGRRVPWIREVDGGSQGRRYERTSYSLECQPCGVRGQPTMPWRGERARDLQVICATCGVTTVDRLNVRCLDCLPDPLPLANPPADLNPPPLTGEPTMHTRLLMRATSFRASDAYYPHTLTFLRLDGDALGVTADEVTVLLRELLGQDGVGATMGEVLASLAARLRAAEDAGNNSRAASLREQIAKVATGRAPLAATGRVRLVNPASDMPKAVAESLALKTRVTSYAYTTLLAHDKDSATAGLVEQIKIEHARLGLQPTQVVEDLPVVAATFGYSRRSFHPGYEEQRYWLPTQLRPFLSLSQVGATRLGRADKAGAVPILAREGAHEGLFLGVDPIRMATWLERNGVALPLPGEDPLVRILAGCEDMGRDRYYDTIWQRPVRRLVFGLVHSLSHAAMRTISRFAGLERTSLSEYVFLPLLGAVVYANSTTMNMGSMEAMVRANMLEFLEGLTDEALSCSLDFDCLDHRGACASCLHAPEICCRVFNHGLSRSLLLGGHAPWVNESDDLRVVGYWETTAEGQ